MWWLQALFIHQAEERTANMQTVKVKPLAWVTSSNSISSKYLSQDPCNCLNRIKIHFISCFLFSWHYCFSEQYFCKHSQVYRSMQKQHVKLLYWYLLQCSIDVSHTSLCGNVLCLWLLWLIFRDSCYMHYINSYQKKCLAWKQAEKCLPMWLPVFFNLGALCSELVLIWLRRPWKTSAQQKSAGTPVCVQSYIRYNQEH